MLTRISILFLLNAVMVVGNALAQQPLPANDESAGGEEVESHPRGDAQGSDEAGDSVPQDPQGRARELARDVDIRLPQLQHTVTLFERPLAFGGIYEVRPRYRNDFALGRRDDDDFFVNQRLRLELLYSVASDVAVFLQGKASYRAELYAEDGDRDSDWKVERGRMWLFADNLLGSDFGIQVGRQRLLDKREWWWDEQLDTVRIHYHPDHLRLWLAVAEDFGGTSTDEDDFDEETEDILRVFGQASWEWAEKQYLEGFLLFHHDHSSSPKGLDRGVITVVAPDRQDEFDADLVWLGARARGRWKLSSKHRLQYWLDAGGVIGEETVFEYLDVDANRSLVEARSTRDVRGWGLDLGATWRIRWPGRPAITLGYAIGSGDRHPRRGTDHAFRQTGLQDNNGRFGGVDRFRYYGELLRPELSNLQIGTLSLGFRFLEKSSVELVYHWYRQVYAARFLRDSELRVDPLGESRDIGQEVDLVVGLEEWKRLELEFVAGLFVAGDAYGPLEGETATLLMLKVNFSF